MPLTEKQLKYIKDTYKYHYFFKGLFLGMIIGFTIFALMVWLLPLPCPK